MSSEKAPLTLRHDETERGHYGKSAPIRYVPEKDPVQGSLSESTVSTNTVKMPGGTKTHVKVWSGRDLIIVVRVGHFDPIGQCHQQLI